MPFGKVLHYSRQDVTTAKEFWQPCISFSELLDHTYNLALLLFYHEIAIVTLKIND